MAGHARDEETLPLLHGHSHIPAEKRGTAAGWLMVGWLVGTAAAAAGWLDAGGAKRLHG